MTNEINFTSVSGKNLLIYDPLLYDHNIIGDIKVNLLNNIIYRNFAFLNLVIIEEYEKNITYDLIYIDKVIKDEEKIENYYGCNITIIVYNDSKSYIRWFKGDYKMFYDLYKTTLNNYVIRRDIASNRNSIFFLSSYKSNYQIELTSLSKNVNGVKLLNSYIMDDNGNYSIIKFIEHRLNNITSLCNIFSNPNSCELINWIIDRLNDKHEEHTNFLFNREELECIFNSYATNENSISYFFSFFHFNDAIMYLSTFENISKNSNLKSLKLIKFIVNKNPNILNYDNIKEAYLSNYPFIKEILDNYDLFGLKVIESDWKFIYKNEYCTSYIISRYDEKKINIDLFKFITNQEFNAVKYYHTIHYIKMNYDSELNNIMKKQDNVICLLSKLSKDNIKEIITFDIINFLDYIEISESFILKNPALDEHILNILEIENFDYNRYKNFWKNISKNPSMLIIDKLFTKFFHKIDWVEMTKQPNANNYLFTKKNIKNIIWDSLCHNYSEEAIKLIYLTILNDHLEIIHLKNLYNFTLQNLEIKIENIKNDKINKHIWIKWKYLSLNPLAVVLLNKCKDKIIWKNVVKNKSEHYILYNIIMYGYNIPNLFDEEIWNNLLSNDNPIMIDFIMKKVKYQTMTDLNWSHLSKNSNPEIINLFNNNLKYRFKIDWKEMSGNKNIYLLDAYKYKPNEIKRSEILNLSYNNGKDLIMLIASNITKYPIRKLEETDNEYLNSKIRFWINSNLPYNKNLDNILKIYKSLDNMSIQFIVRLMINTIFYDKVLTNEKALETINEYKYLHLNFFNQFIQTLVKNPLFFCTENEWKIYNKE